MIKSTKQKNGKKCYCAFWYPTIFHQTDQIKPIKGFSTEGVDISDHANASLRLFLDVKEDESQNLIFTTYNISAGFKVNEEELHLHLEQHSNNGFSVYSYQDEKVDFNDFLYGNVFYHHAKSLHHQHEVNPDSDSSLTAMSLGDSCFNPEDIFSPDNVVLQYYLLQYEELFGEVYAKEISERNHDFDDDFQVFRIIRSGEFVNKIRNSTPDEILKQDEKIHLFYYNILEIIGEGNDKKNEYVPKVHRLSYYKRMTRKIRRIQGKYYQVIITLLSELCNNAKMEYTYCKTLLNSKYNKEIKPYIEFSPEEDALLKNADNNDRPDIQLLVKRDKARKSANNIINSISYIESVMNKCSSREEEHIRYVLEDARRSNMISFIVALISVFVTILSLVVAILMSKC